MPIPHNGEPPTAEAILTVDDESAKATAAESPATSPSLEEPPQRGSPLTLTLASIAAAVTETSPMTSPAPGSSPRRAHANSEAMGMAIDVITEDVAAPAYAIE